MIKLSDYVFKYLAEYGVKDVFMLSGGGCMHLVNSVGTNPDINYYCCLFEQAVSLSADAYAPILITCPLVMLTLYVSEGNSTLSTI